MVAAVTVRANGKAEMAYVGDAPWHGLGEQLAIGAPIEEWIRAAGMDWRIQRGIVRFATRAIAGGEAIQLTGLQEMPDKHVLFRSDTKAPLGVVSDGYQVVQPRAVLEFFRDLTDKAGFTLETAGTLFDGKRFWALASTGDAACIADPADKVKGFLLLSTSCDGTLATEGRYTTVRVVCNNTLTAARSTDKAKFRVTHRSKFNADDAKRELGVDAAHRRFAETMDNMRRLADTRMTDEATLAQTMELFQPGAADLAAKEFKALMNKRPVQEVGKRALGAAIGADMQGVTGTQWGWLNAVTEYVDHAARARDDSNRLNSAWFGKGDALKTRAYEMALAGADGRTLTYAAELASVDMDGSDDFARLLGK